MNEHAGVLRDLLAVEKQWQGQGYPAVEQRIAAYEAAIAALAAPPVGGERHEKPGEAAFQEAKANAKRPALSAPAAPRDRQAALDDLAVRTANGAGVTRHAPAAPVGGSVPKVLRDAHAEALKWSPKSFAGADAIRAFQVLAGDYVGRLLDESLAAPAPVAEDKPPYKAGDEVHFEHGGDAVAVVRQCFSAVGGWRVYAQVKGRERTANKGMIDYPADKLTPATPPAAEPAPPTQNDEPLHKWAERVATQFSAMGEGYDARKLRALLAWAQAADKAASHKTAAEPVGEKSRDPSHSWPTVDRVLIDAYNAGTNGDTLDLIASRKAIIAAAPASPPGVVSEKMLCDALGVPHGRAIRVVAVESEDGDRQHGRWLAHVPTAARKITAAIRRPAASEGEK